MLKGIKYYFTLLFFLFFSTSMFSSDKLLSNYTHKIWNIDNGLTQGTITSIEQTPDGYIWFGNQEALSRFDGVKFKNFNKKNTPVFKSSWIQSLALSGKGNLLIGTWRGGIYRRKNNKIESLNFNNKRLIKSVVYSIKATKKGEIWAGTSDGLFFIKNNQVKRYGFKDGLLSKKIRALEITSEGKLWIGTEDKGLMTYKQGKFRTITTSSGLKNNHVWALKKDGKGGLWIGSGNILTHLTEGNFKYFPVPVSSLPNNITCIKRENIGDLWIGLQNGGLWQFSNNEFKSFTTKDGLLSNLVISIMKDNEKNIWVGTHGVGVVQFLKESVRTISMEEGLSTKQVWTVLEAKDGSLWAGTFGGGLNKIKKGKITHYALKDGLSSMNITALSEAKNGTLWIGTGDNGFIKYKNGKFYQYKLGNSLEENTVYSIYQKKDNSLIIGTAGGLIFWNDGKIIKKVTTENGLSNNVVREIIKRKDNEFWIATDVGLNLLKNNKIFSWTKKNGLKEGAVIGLYLDDKNNLWIGTYGGGLMHFKNNHFTQISEENGLFNNAIYEMLEDRYNRLWMSSNKGIFYVEKKDLLAFIKGGKKSILSISFGKEDGMKSLECNGGRTPAGWITKDGKVCFPTADGIAMINTAKISQKGITPFPLIDQVKINGRQITLRNDIKIQPGKGNLEFEFTAPFFTTPDKVKFKFYLKNFEKKWKYTKDIRRAYYTNIPPGTYTFVVNASNRYNVWNKKPATINFTLKPYFYQTTVFYLLIGFTVLFVGFGLYKWRIYQLERRKKELEKTVDVRTKELIKAYDKMKELSITDALTKLYNRRYFHHVVEKNVSFVIRQHMKKVDQKVTFAIGFLMIDIDYFKKVNDCYGHNVGDLFLQKISKKFLDTIRTSDLIVRWGGEEFLILSKENDFEGAKLLALRLMNAVAEEEFDLDGIKIKKTISVGFCSFPVIPLNPKAISWEKTVDLADQALYIAKQSGRNCSVGIKMIPEKLTPENIELLKNDLNKALEKEIVKIEITKI